MKKLALLFLLLSTLSHGNTLRTMRSKSTSFTIECSTVGVNQILINGLLLPELLLLHRLGSREQRLANS